MMKTRFLFFAAVVSWLLFGGLALGQSPARGASTHCSFSESRESNCVQIAQLRKTDLEKEEDEAFDTPRETVPDPLEPLNRAFFEFNDKFYFWVLKPVATGYKTVVPEEVRVCTRNFFTNLAYPVRLVNNLLQGKFFGAFEETCGFVVNSIVGLGGLADVAKALDLKTHDEDLGQTLAVYGAGPAFYIHWPFLGPSTLRDTIGRAGDIFLDPLTYLGDYWYAPWSRGLNVVNDTSLRIGDYESLKRAALDPYIALRDAYYQNRLSKIEE